MLENNNDKIIYSKFQNTLLTLCLKRHTNIRLMELLDNNIEPYPTNVAGIILADRDTWLKEQMLLLNYFIQENYLGVPYKNIKLKKYISFIREQRAILFPKYKTRISSKKFIANIDFKRSSTIDDYIEKYIIGDKDVK